MRTDFDPDFYRQYKRLGVRVRNQVDERLKIFFKNPLDPRLRNHKLKDKWVGYRSIDITNDYRALYKEVMIGKETVAYFSLFGTHKELSGERK